MKRGPSTRPPLVRMARSHALLRQGARVTAARIAADLETSRRTIFRDLDFMRYQLDLPIEYDERAHTYTLTGPTDRGQFGPLFGKEVAS